MNRLELFVMVALIALGSLMVVSIVWSVINDHMYSGLDTNLRVRLHELVWHSRGGRCNALDDGASLDLLTVYVLILAISAIIIFWL